MTRQHSCTTRATEYGAADPEAEALLTEEQQREAGMLPRTARAHEVGGSWLEKEGFEQGARGRWRREVGRIWRENLGLTLIVLSALNGQFMNLVVKLMTRGSDSTDPFEIVAIRMVPTWFICVGYMKWRRIEHPIKGPPGVRLLLLTRGAFGFFGLFGMYYALKYLSLSDATVISFLSPLIIGLLGYLFLNEPYTHSEALSALFSLLGVVLIARPMALFGGAAGGGRPEDGLPVHSGDADVHMRKDAREGEGEVGEMQRLAAVGIALVGIALGSCSWIANRAIGKRAHPFHQVSYFALACFLQSCLGMFLFQVPVFPPPDWGWVAALAIIVVFGLAGQTLSTLGLAREKAGRAAMGSYSGIIFAAILERVVLGVTPPLLSFIGCAIILGSALYVAVTKSRAGAADVEAPSTKTQRHSIVSLEGSPRPREEAGGVLRDSAVVGRSRA